MVVRVKGTAKKCTKRCDVGAKLSFCLLSLLLSYCSCCIKLLQLSLTSLFLSDKGGGRGGRVFCLTILLGPPVVLASLLGLILEIGTTA